WVQVPNASGEAAGLERQAAAPYVPLSWGRRAFLIVALAGSLSLAFWSPQSAQRAPHHDAMSDRGPVADEPADPDPVRRWSARAPLPVARGRFGCVTWGGSIYVIAGETAEGATGAVEVYDPASDSWRSGAPKPTAVANVVAAVLGDEVYVPGGYDSHGQVVAGVEVYTPATDSWRSACPLPVPRCGYALAATGGRLYLFGGWDGSRYVADVLIYDPEQDAWTYGTPLGRARAFAAAATYDARIYLAGGYDGTNELALCEVYDPALEGTDQSPWRALAPMSEARGGLGLVVAGTRLYAVGGGWNGRLAYNESYEVSSDRWRPFPSPVLGRWRTLGLAAVESSLGTTLYAMGGWSGDLLAVNQAYRALLNIYLPGLQ
ncbi:MAG: kelch repeat-containing protein, partial [Anaerolineae bacterium]|nr:kelch repeat-containing protein [Anaerolineae bacterium]